MIWLQDLLPSLLPSSDRAVAPSRGWRYLAAVVVLALAVSALWIASIPPFEGPDELFFYNRARQFAAAPERRENAFFRLAAPIIRVMSPDAGLVHPNYNPAFQFIGNRRGEVNRFVHDRSVAPHEHVRTLIALRALTALLAALTMAIIYGIARLVLGDARRALLVAAVCICIPQSSFMNAVVHPEAATRLVAAIITLVVAAGATGSAPRWVVWTALLAGIALVPFADRQALFLAPFAAISLIAIERTWKGRAAAAAAIILPAIAAVIVVMHTEAGTDFGPWLRLIRHPLQPLLSADPSRGSSPPDLPYYVFEFFPKLFTGFWGWLGQPSLLLPAWTFALAAVLTMFAGIGVLMPASQSAAAADRGRRKARRLLAIGIVLMMLPILYGPSVAGRDLWYGRWLFAMLGPLAIALVLGLERFAAFARAHGDAASAAVGALAVAGAALWFAPSGDAVRALIATHHYGDIARFADVVRDVPIVLACVAVAIAVAARTPAAARVPAGALVVCILAANALTAAALVQPLYAPLSASEYEAQIRSYLASGRTAPAADLYASAIASYPDSIELRRLGDESPRLLLGRGEAPLTQLWARIARGQSIDDRESLLVLAHEAAGDPAAAAWRGSDAVAATLEAAARRRDLAEPAALLRLAVEGGAASADAAARPIAAGGGTRIGASLRNGELVVEGVTHHPTAGGGTQLIVYFTPHVDAVSRRLWLHAYPVADRRDYLDLVPTLAPTVWKPGQLAWASFELPAGRYDTYVGVWVGYDIGPGQPIGVLPS